MVVWCLSAFSPPRLAMTERRRRKKADVDVDRGLIAIDRRSRRPIYPFVFAYVRRHLKRRCAIDR